MADLLFIFLAVFLVLFLAYYFIKNPQIGIFLLIFSLPFERIPSYDVSFFGNITIRPSQLVGLALFLALIYRLIQRKQKLIIEKNLFLYFYLIVALLSFTKALDLTRSALVFAFTAFVIIVYFLIVNFVTQKRHLEKIEKALFWSTLMVCLFGIYQFIADTIKVPLWLTGLKPIYVSSIFGFPRIQSVALEPLYFASFLLIPFALFTVLALKKEGFSKRYFLIIFLSLFSIVLTLSRGGFAAILAILAVLFIFLFKEWIIRKGLYIFLTMVLAIILAVSSISISTYITNKSAKLGVENISKQSINISSGESVEVRAKTRNHAINLFLANPVLGVGIGNFGPNIAGYPSSAPEEGWLVVNNEPLEILAETGILGFLSILFFLGILFFKGFYDFYKSKDLYLKIWLLGLLAVFLAFVVQYQTFSTLYITHIWVVIGLLAATQNIFQKNKGIKNA